MRQVRGTSVAAENGGRRWGQRLLATGLGSLLAVGAIGTGASAADGDEDADTGEDEGDTAETSGEADAQLEELDPCVADFGVGKTLVVFDDPEFDPDQAEVDVALVGEHENCLFNAEVGFTTPEELAEDYPNRSLDAPQLEGVTHIAVIEVDVFGAGGVASAREDVATTSGFDDLSYAVSVDWDVRGEVARSFGPYERSLCDADTEGYSDCIETVATEAFAHPIVLSPFVDLELATTWSDADGEAIDAPADGWDATLAVGDDERLALPGDEGASTELIDTQTYAVAASAPDGFEEVTCDAVPSGTGDEFVAEDDGTHEVCFQQAAVEEEVDDEVEAEPVVATPDADAEELPATGAPIGLALLGTGLLAAGGVAVRRSTPHQP